LQPLFHFAAFVISFALASERAPHIDSRIVSDGAAVPCPVISFVFSHIGNDAMKINEIKAAIRFLPLFPRREAGV
jgi:hypothetical protein